LKRILVTLILFISIFPAAFSTSCHVGYSGPVDSITVAYSPFESTALVWIAKNLDYFNHNGLNVSFRKYDTGAGALDGIIKSEADIVAGTTEYPVVGKALQDEKIRIIATIDKANFIYLVARKDRGISQVSDLKGKRVGTTFGTLAHFYLGSLLDVNNISMKDITLVDLKTPDEWVNAVVNGDVDAMVTAQPYANRAADLLGSNACLVSAQAGRFLYALAISSEGWLTNHQETARRFLKALVQAEDYLQSHPAGAKAIIMEELNLDASYMATVWSQNGFSLSLDQSLILAMEDETRWMMSHNLTGVKTVPNFLDYISSDALKAVKPNAISIIGK
jgi:ABC-type nitrate/sulfonate/bicarbonate transport system substrate-binding protein